MMLEKDAKFEEKVTCSLEKWHEEFGKFSPEHTKVSKLWLLLGHFIQSRKCISLKFTRVLCVMTMKNDTKFEKELTVCIKLTWGI